MIAFIAALVVFATSVAGLVLLAGLYLLTPRTLRGLL